MDSFNYLFSAVLSFINSKTLLHNATSLVAPASYLSNLTLASMPVMVNVLIALLFEGAVIIIGRTRFKERLHWRDFFLIAMTLTACLLVLL